MQERANWGRREERLGERQVLDGLDSKACVEASTEEKTCHVHCGTSCLSLFRSFSVLWGILNVRSDGQLSNLSIDLAECVLDVKSKERSECKEECRLCTDVNIDEPLRVKRLATPGITKDGSTSILDEVEGKEEVTEESARRWLPKGSQGYQISVSCT